MKLPIRLLAGVAAFLLLAGCNVQNNAESGQVAVPPEAPEESGAAAEGQEATGRYEERICQGLSQFRQLGNTNPDLGSIGNLVIETRNTFGHSAEGSVLTRFSTKEGTVVRYTLEVLGESGNSTANYYFFEDGLLYIQILKIYYVEYAFSGENRQDILQYQLETYVVDSGELIPVAPASLNPGTEMNPTQVSSLEELEAMFVEATARTQPLYPAEQESFVTTGNARFNFWLSFPEGWSAYDASQNGDGFYINCGNPQMDIRAYGKNYFLELEAFQEAPAGILEKAFAFSGGVVGTCRELPGESIEFSYISKDTEITFYVNYAEDPQWYEENKELIEAVARTLRDGLPQEAPAP